MRIRISHTTRFSYANPPAFGLVQLRARPQTSPAQTVHDWQLDLAGAREQARFSDGFGNAVDLVELLPDATEVELTVSGEVDTHIEDGVVGRVGSPGTERLYLRQTPLTEPDPAMAGLLENLPDTDPLDRLHALSRLVLGRVAYTPGETHAGTTAREAFRDAEGVCQDHTHIFCGLARHLGTPARYVGGYLLMDDRTEQDAGHAWAEGFVPDLGWVGFDISNGISPDGRYIRVAHGLDYRDAAPTRGMTVASSGESLSVDIRVEALQAQQ